MIDPKRREMFADLYRLAEYYENPPFAPGAIHENSMWFITAATEALNPFLIKYQNRLATDLAFAIVEEANQKAVEANKAVSVL